MTLERDIRYALRALRKTPAFALGAMLTIALAVGATTAIFSVVYGILLRQLPYRDVERVFWVWSDQPGRDRSPFNVPDFIDHRDSTKALASYAGFFSFSANLSDESAAERVQGIRATGNLFDVLGATARLGRLLRPADEQPGRDHVVVLAEPFWRRRFGGDDAIIGRMIRLNSEEYEVVGVAPTGLVMPVAPVDFILPFAPEQDPRRGARNSLNFIIGVGRLADGVAVSQAASELTGIARRLQQQFPVENARKRGIRLVAIIDGVVGTFRTALWTLFAAVAAVLLIACANLANLMLTRAVGRRKEVAVQLALGSSRWAVVRQVMIEALLVSSAGGLLGLVVARWSVRGLVALAPTQLPRSGEVRVDIPILLFSLLVSALAGVLFGVLPALMTARVDVRDALQGESRGVTGGVRLRLGWLGRGWSRRGLDVRGALVSAEVALAVVLLIVMTMLAKSFAKVQDVAPGFQATNVLSARLTLPAKRFNNRNAIVTFQRSLAEQLLMSPQVTHTGVVSVLPLSGLLARVPFTVEGRAIERERVPLAQFRTVSAGYFEAAGIPLRRGRTFAERDIDTAPAVAVVNEELAKHWLDGLDPVGARLLVDDSDGPPRPVEIIGVVGNVRQIALDVEPTWDLYVTYLQVHADNVASAAASMFWVVRTTSDPSNLATTLAAEVRRLDPEVAASQIRPMVSYLSDTVAPRRFSLSLMAAFSGAALLLAIVGIYSVVSYSVSQRAREIAIRLALGATRSTIARLVLGHGVRFIAVGLIVGVALAVGAMRLVGTMLFGVAPLDTTTFAQVTVLVLAVSVAACLVPSARASRSILAVTRGE